MSAKARLLIVDDEPLQMRALCQTLTAAGYFTAGFNSPQQALAALQETPFDLLLTDLMMSEMDGIALLDAARAIQADLAVIVMTGHGAVDTAVRAMKGGAFDYILKPFRLNVVLPVIARALEVQQLRRENAALVERERLHAQELSVAYRDLESFSYSVSHDLRSPLRAIAGFAQMLEEDRAEALGDEGRRQVTVIRDGCRRMDDLIVGLLEFSRIGRSAFKVDSIDMRALAVEAAEETRNAFSGPPPEINIAELPTIEGDSAVMRQVWVNLIGNALKYSARQPVPKVEISAQVENNQAVFHIRDNGAGFDMRYVDRLFGVFQRLHRDSEFQGTGVGLAIVQRIIVRHSGRIWAEAVPDGGACFHFALPLLAKRPAPC